MEVVSYGGEGSSRDYLGHATPTASKLREDPTVKLANPSSSGLTSLPLLGD